MKSNDSSLRNGKDEFISTLQADVFFTNLIADGILDENKLSDIAESLASHAYWIMSRRVQDTFSNWANHRAERGDNLASADAVSIKTCEDFAQNALNDAWFGPD